MYMSGWAPHDKQPWAFGEPYTSYNRKWLQLKSRLSPYLHLASLSMQLLIFNPIWIYLG